ncbi:probable beta-D-xylosidase 7 [Nicotiana tomentosiformis]|uniref:probable beta-D-xylosidase 7 n=1 Tax=Nicotiana tomentosiformis TaxID=4098 RepID=UPI00051BB0AA|nr:probable beta-D-xylosidase 7 [Nicotiana tomentosiformis]
MKLDTLALINTLLWLTLISTSESTQPPFSCDSSLPLTKSLKFCQSALPISVRAKDLVSRLTLDEKISQLVNSAPAIPRLGIPAYEWWSESLHGVGAAGRGIFFNGSIVGATSFPQVILTAASFDENLWYRIGQVIGREARGVYNAGEAVGMTFWAPNINIFRDPRWGRGQETPGEDPSMSGKYAIRYVRGVQGDSFEGGKLKKGHLQASACCKHFTAYDLDQWKTLDRFSFNAIVTPQDMADTFQPPFQDCIQKAQASGIMCSYNSVNGIPSCANYNLLTKTARQQWGFHGYITSDCDAVQVMHDNHKYAKTPEDAAAFALKAGMDVNCGDYLRKYTKSAIMQKKVSEAHVDRALHNLFSIRMRLGLFNGNPTKQLFGNISPNLVCAQQHQELALEAARSGIVLLKNTGKLLPLSKAKTNSLAVIGPNANSAYVLRGNYDGPPCKSIEILKALSGYVKTVQYHPGCNAVNCTSAAIDQAVNAAKNVDYVVLVMGLDQGQEREQFDRDDLVLPGQQEKLINSVAKAAKKPVILVLLSGGPVDVSFAKINTKIGSILWAGYPGEAGGLALAEIIFGEHNPGGKLPITWYPQEFVKIPMTDMRMRPNPATGYPGRTYRFYKGPKVFEFGYGLSYTTYSYEFSYGTPKTVQLNQLSTAKTVQGLDSIRYTSVEEMGIDNCEKAKFSAHVSVKNSGEMDGKHPVLLFVKQDEKVQNGSPVKQLVGFQSVSLKAGENSEIVFEISPCEHLSSANEDGLMMIEEGSRYLVVGDAEHPINIMI